MDASFSAHLDRWLIALVIVCLIVWWLCSHGGPDAAERALPMGVREHAGEGHDWTPRKETVLRQASVG